MLKIQKIAVVGGGLAGLSAAFRLLQAGNCQVDVFESRPQLGGRVQSRKVRGREIDFGGFLIYPWYQATHELLRDLGLTDRLARTPLSDIYYFLNDGVARREQDIPFAKQETLELWAKSIFKILPKANLAHPDLNSFNRETISEYLRKTLDKPTHAGLYETYFDTVNQGYCYGPVDCTKAAFMAPIIRQVTLHGDIESTSFFPDGGKVLITALAEQIELLGGQIHLNTPIVAIDKLKLRTQQAEFAVDAVVFAQTVSNDLYCQIMPETKPECWYTHFITAAVELDETPVIGAGLDWGALFYAPELARPQQVLSVINLASLYGSELKNCLILNIIIRDQTEQILATKEIKKIVDRELGRLFPQLAAGKILEQVHWSKTMPVAQESFVEMVRKQHGQAGYFFAGDFLGAPSMETAIATGAIAAKDVLAAWKAING